MVLGTVFALSTGDQVLALEKKIDDLDITFENQDSILTWQNSSQFYNTFWQWLIKQDICWTL